MVQSLVSIFSNSSSGIGALGLNGESFLIQLVTFLIVILVLRQWAVKPILRVLQRRRELIDKGVELGEAMEKAQAELDAKVEKELKDARSKADDIIRQSEQEGRRQIQAAELAAHEKTDSIIETADQEIAQKMNSARKQLEKELVGLVSDATEVIIGERVDAKKDASLIDKALRARRAA
jgi:F-type H+-transporting ATPase subunit b